MSATRRELIQRLQGNPEWSLIDVDGVAVLFARNTPGHRVAIAAAVDRLRRLNAPAAATAKAIVPPPRLKWPAAIFGPRRVSFDAWGRGTCFVQLDMPEAARREFRQALRTADRPEPALVKAYVVVASRLGRLEEARAWCRRLVEIAP